jgi:hypothetical protein
VDVLPDIVQQEDLLKQSKYQFHKRMNRSAAGRSLGDQVAAGDRLIGQLDGVHLSKGQAALLALLVLPQRWQANPLLHTRTSRQQGKRWRSHKLTLDRCHFA